MTVKATLSGGAALALMSAALFGTSVPLAKLLVGQISPWLLAGLLYLGAGLGLLVVERLRAGAEAPLARVDWYWLAPAVLTGGVVGPVLLMAGLKAMGAAGASLLLPLEGLFSALIAWFVFGEGFDRRILLGFGAITAGAAILAAPEGFASADLAGPLLVAGACLTWGIDNNLTRKVALADPVRIARIKCLVAGTVNSALALILGAAWPSWPALGAASALGFAGYGLSLVLFVLALRQLGAARTAAYFAAAPFIGAALAVPLLAEPVTSALVLGGLLMVIGVWLHLAERHEHLHVHEPVAHAHRHVHDAHHQHVHDGSEPPGEPHSHWHEHEPLEHSHPHYPDSHHRHRH